LDLGLPGAELTVLCDLGLFILKGPDSKWLLPAGRYRTARVMLNRTDPKGDKWTLTGYYSGDKLGTFAITQGEMLAVKVGPPLAVKARPTRSGKATVIISLSLTGQAGEEYSPGVEKNGETQPAPKFKILDESGKVLLSDSFEYG